MKVKEYSNECINDIVSKSFEIMEPSDYVKLRNTTCARLTLFNARRGGEAARMLLTEFNEANRNEWINEEEGDELSKHLVNELKIAYLMGERE